MTPAKESMLNYEEQLKQQAIVDYLRTGCY
jgi:hypothetical protein